MLPDCFTLPVILMALFASCGGCVIRYIETYKAIHQLKISFFILDLFIAAFQGFFLAWHLLDHHTELAVSQVMVILILVGFLGSKIFDIASYLLYKKFGINIKFNNKDIDDGSTRNQK